MDIEVLTGIDAVIFDFDLTLADSTDAVVDGRRMRSSDSASRRLALSTWATMPLTPKRHTAPACHSPRADGR